MNETKTNMDYLKSEYNEYAIDTQIYLMTFLFPDFVLDMIIPKIRALSG